MSEDIKYCPIFSIALHRIVECLEERCAWYGGKGDFCVVKDLGTIADWFYEPRLEARVRT